MDVTCIHCEDVIHGKCPTCKKNLAELEQCSDCHQELVHGKIKNQNVHMTGNAKSSSLESEDKGGDIGGYAWY